MSGPNERAPAPEPGKRAKAKKWKQEPRAHKRKREQIELEQLEQEIAHLDPKEASFNTFAEIPLSEPTKAGLKAAKFVDLTDIQKKAIPFALKDRDILGAARTGSGKTLAFVVPVLENLFRAQCIGPDAGLGAMIISPTRELAIQIFEVLRKVGGKGHMFAAGLVIGGKSLQEEQAALVRMNIVVCTPGRMLQHLSQTAAFSPDFLRMLVLDEADRILDMGFQRDVDAIVDYLPQDRQTMLFSATQTKKVSDLARLSLKNPEYISVHEAAASATPQNLQQNYVVTSLPDKLDTLWSFLQSVKKNKVLVFLSSGKQVRFVYESFRRMQPGIPLLHIHGRQKQTARLDITTRFSESKSSCLFATDVAARGLDFPAVDWVVQVDCPEDADTYIHRVGRTARYQRDGRAVLFLDPSEEEGMLERLEQKKIPIERINVKPNKQQSIKTQLQNMCFKEPDLKYTGQKAFISYVKSVYLQKDKDVFKLDELPLEEFADSLGLPGAPRIKFRKGDDTKQLKNKPRKAAAVSSDEEEDAEGNSKRKKKDGVRTKYDRMFERQNQDVLADHHIKLIQEEDESDDDTKGEHNGAARPSGDQDSSDDDFMNVKRRIAADDELDTAYKIPKFTQDGQKLLKVQGAKDPVVIDSKRREKLLGSKKQLAKLKSKGERVVFDDEGHAHQLYELQDEDQFKSQGAPEEQRQQFAEEERQKLQLADVSDKALAKDKKRVKTEKRKARERAERDGGERDEDDGVQLEGGDDHDAFADFVADAASSDNEDVSDEDDDEPDAKRPRKWFEEESEQEATKSHKAKKAKKQRQEVEGPETLEDLEDLASGLLAR